MSDENEIRNRLVLFNDPGYGDGGFYRRAYLEDVEYLLKLLDEARGFLKPFTSLVGTSVQSDSSLMVLGLSNGSALWNAKEYITGIESESFSDDLRVKR